MLPMEKLSIFSFKLVSAPWAAKSSSGGIELGVPANT